MNTFSKFHLVVKIDLIEVAYYLKLKQVLNFLSKLYDKSCRLAWPLHFLIIIDIVMLHFHQLL